MRTLTAADFPPVPSLVLMVTPTGSLATVNQVDVPIRELDGWRRAEIGEQVAS